MSAIAVDFDPFSFSWTEYNEVIVMEELVIVFSFFIMLHLCDLDLNQYAVKYMDATDRAEEGWEVVQMAVNKKTVFMRACIGACTVVPE